MTFQHIDEKKKRLDEKRPLPVNTVKSLRENMLVEWTYSIFLSKSRWKT